MQQNIKTLLKSLILTLASISLFATFVPANSFADLPNRTPGPAEYLLARQMNAVAKCTRAIDNSGEPALKASISEEERNRMDIFRFGEGNKGRIVVGFDADLGGGDGIAACENLAIGAIRVVGEFYDKVGDFADLFYTKSGSSYTRKSESERKAASDALLANQYVAAADTGDIRKIRLAAGFSQCFKEDDGGADDAPGLSTKYRYLSGKSSGSNIKIGLGQSGGTSEELSCGTLANLAKSSQEGLVEFMEEYDVTTATLRNSPLDLYANIRASGLEQQVVSAVRGAVTTALTANPGKVLFCLSSAGLPSIGVASIAEWLITGDAQTYLVYSGPGSSSIPATEEQTNALSSCLLDENGLGTELRPWLSQLEGVLEAIEADRVANSGSASTGEVVSDDCLANDAFIGWVVCPALNAIDSVLESLEDIIQGMLRFSLDDTTIETANGPLTIEGQNKDDRLRTAWNVFRSLATVIIVIGFLTALLVKTIKGE